MLPTDERTVVMGVLNVTPDSFSDGGDHFDPGAAIERGLEMIEQGADLIDVGGESTRPGSLPVSEDEERRRVVPVVASLTAAGGVVSIDTTKGAVARAALDTGAAVVNDVTALADPETAAAAAAAGAGVVLMHMQGAPRTMQEDPHYDDVVTEVRDFLLERAAVAEAAGIRADAICLDPGIGFGKTLEHNLALLRRIDVLAAAGYPVLVGASRKSFLQHLLGPTPAAERDPATAAAHVLAVAGGATLIRVHNVVMGLRTARVADAIVRAGGGEWR